METKFYGYSERGMMNALFTEFYKKPKLITEFIKLAELDKFEEPKECQIYLEWSLSGFGEPDLIKKNFLHLVGNLALLTQSQNSKFGNKSFEEKKELFQDTALSSYTEIRENLQWTEKEIETRHENISKFAKKYFDTSDL